MSPEPDEFAERLRDAVKQKHGRLITCAHLARELASFTNGKLDLTSETVRKWMRGISLPRANAVAVLESYLGVPLVNNKVRLNVDALNHDQLVQLQYQVLQRLNEISTVTPMRRR